MAETLLNCTKYIGVFRVVISELFLCYLLVHFNDPAISKNIFYITLKPYKVLQWWGSRGN